ncbi:MAG: exosortase/archaeosortase family protein [Planctomycetes bacterium]|nr:exosortase/archaeosortase family protein [Planctomycetota bacterium]
MNGAAPRNHAEEGSVFTSRPLLLVWLSLFVAAVWCMRVTWSDLLTIASRDEEQSHIILVPFIALWLAWVRRVRLRHLHPRGTLFGVMIMLMGWAASYIGYYHAIQSAWHAGAVIVIIGVAVTGLGINTLLRLFPAFAVSVFAVPTPGTIRHAISGPLQTASAAITQVILESFGVPVERSMNLLNLNGHDIAVAEACNGMRMVLALILVSYAFAFSLPLRPYARVLVLVLSPVAAIFCNIVRLLPTVLLYGYAPIRVADAFHDISGWLMLPVAFLLLRGIYSVLGWAQIPVTRFNLSYQ